MIEMQPRRLIATMIPQNVARLPVVPGVAVVKENRRAGSIGDAPVATEDGRLIGVAIREERHAGQGRGGLECVLYSGVIGPGFQLDAVSQRRPSVSQA